MFALYALADQHELQRMNAVEKSEMPVPAPIRLMLPEHILHTYCPN